MTRNKRQVTFYHLQMGERIDIILKEKGLTRKGAMIACGYGSTGRMSQIIKSGSGMPESKYYKLCKYLGVEPETLVFPGKYNDEQYSYLYKFLEALDNYKDIENFKAAMLLIQHGMSNLTKKGKE